MKNSARKQIRLKEYDYSQNGAYYITLCTHKKQKLFGEISDATLSSFPNRPDLLIEKWLHETENKFTNTKLDYFVIMPNHVHLILFLTGDHIGSPLPQIIDWFKTMTTNEYINGVKKGLYKPFEKHIWQRSYFDHIIRNDEDLYNTRKYIEQNPPKWELDKMYVK